MDNKDILKLLKTSEYDFLRENIHLQDRIGMLCLGGSLSYGTSIEGKSDIDLRGFAFETPAELIGITNSFNQIVEVNTDTTIYAFNKFIKLLLENNPNIIELLGCKPEYYLYMTDVSKELIKHRKMFLTTKCIRSFGGYAGQQLARLENAIARDSLPQARKEEHSEISLNNAMASFVDKYTEFEQGSIILYIDDSIKENMDKEVFADINLRHYPVRDLSGILSEFTNITKQYGKLNHRNKKKDDEHLNKHAMHLIRLYYMVFDLLEKGDIVTYREAERPFLLEIRKGKFMCEDGTYDKSFYDFRDELDKRFQYAQKHTVLPDKVNMKEVEDFIMDVNERIVRKEL